MRPILRRWLAVSLLATTGACFPYVPTPGVTERGTRVRLELSRPVPVELEDITANNVVHVRGELVTADADRFVLSVFALESEGGFEYLARGETVLLPADAVGRIEERRFSLVRTALAAAALSAVGYLLQLGLRGAIGGGEGGDGPGNTR